MALNNDNAEEFDFVVVGAGSAGCAVAARLSESGAHRVALLEAGGEDDSFWIHTPIGFGMLYDNPKYNWMYQSEPEAALNGATQYLPRGKVLGGTSSINGMIYSRGQRRDFDHWKALGNVGWGFDDVQPYFRKSEDNVLGAVGGRGVGGPITVSNLPQHDLADAFVQAGVEAGYKKNDITDGNYEDGFSYNQTTTRNGRRCSTAVGYLRPARGRKNLKIITRAMATRVLMEGRRAVGVEYTQGGIVKRVLARREVALASGAFNSPQLLQLSGIGPAAVLKQQGIAVVHASPGVGENLQDHFGFWGAYRCTQPITINDVVNNPIRRYLMGLRYLLFRDGYMSYNPSYVSALIRTDPSLQYPNARLNLALWSRVMMARVKEKFGLRPFSSFSVYATLLHPDSRGSCHINSPRADVQPVIRFNFLQSENDRQAAIATIRAMQRVVSMPSMAKYVAEYLQPTVQQTSDEDLLAYLRECGRTNHHPTSTCKMGVDDMAVVDPRLRVRGVEGLRVIDASIMPRVVAGNANAGVIMIGEKGAAMMLEDARVNSQAA